MNDGATLGIVIGTFFGAMGIMKFLNRKGDAEDYENPTDAAGNRGGGKGNASSVGGRTKHKHKTKRQTKRQTKKA